MNHVETRHTIVRLLSNIGSAKEIQQYLKRFSQLDAARFAVVKVGGAILQDDLENLASSLAFLQQVGLTPIVIHGAGPQLNAELAKAGIETPIIDGLRVTSPEALKIVRRVFHAENLKLVEALQAMDARASSIFGRNGSLTCVSATRSSKPASPASSWVRNQSSSARDACSAR